MSKRQRSPKSWLSPKKPRLAHLPRAHTAVATYRAAAAVDADPPLARLNHAMQTKSESQARGSCVVWWIRMQDLRLFDNKALSQASQHAKRHNIPLVAIFVICEQEYHAHHRSPRRIDFTLRNLGVLRASLSDLHIPLQFHVELRARDIPRAVVSRLVDWGSKALYASIEYEVDELRRDLRVVDLCDASGLSASFVYDRCAVAPGLLASKTGNQFAVYSPWLKQWVTHLEKHPEAYARAQDPSPNDKSIRESATFAPLFESQVPELDDFACEDREKMAELWPAGTAAALQILERFLHNKSLTAQLGPVDPLGQDLGDENDRARLAQYSVARDKADSDTTSRISPYLAAGVISVRECIRQTLKLRGANTIDAGRGTGIGTWVQELAWRDFYTHVMAAFPRVSMGRPFQEKYADVRWETNDAHLQAWKDGKTGVPIVDAAMRQLKEHGWMHNRSRMITAMYLTKDLMLDWHLGEEHFMRNLVDGDLSSNNGGWQWSSSTGTDSQPYFRIFNPYLQSEKADPSGNYIRHFVPELRTLRGKALYDPSSLPKDAFAKLGYPKPLVNHKVARERALRRFKNPGEA